MHDFDVGRAMLKGPDQFPRFRVPSEGERLADAGYSPSDELLVVDKQGARRALLMHELAYPHIAQGELKGEPYVVAF